MSESCGGLSSQRHALDFPNAGIDKRHVFFVPVLHAKLGFFRRILEHGHFLFVLMLLPAFLGNAFVFQPVSTTVQQLRKLDQLRQKQRSPGLFKLGLLCGHF